MRITANIPDNIGRVVKTFADNEKKSVSSVITDAVRNYIVLKKKKESGMKVLDLIGKAHVSKDIHKDIESMRTESHDRY
jgi:metal-responsive CopG/Arc/MetJ family transcriptional regulator